jgi:hypothetical protein
VIFIVLIVIGTAAAYLYAIRVPARSQLIIPLTNSVLVGLLLGAAAIFGVTLMVQQDTKPQLPANDGSNILNRVEYGDRS